MAVLAFRIKLEYIPGNEIWYPAMKKERKKMSSGPFSKCCPFCALKME